MIGTLEEGEVPIKPLTVRDLDELISKMGSRNDAPKVDPVAILNQTTFAWLSGLAFDGTFYRQESKLWPFRALRWLMGRKIY